MNRLWFPACAWLVAVVAVWVFGLRATPAHAAPAATDAGAASSACQGRRPWKSANAIQYPKAELQAFYGLAKRMTDAYEGGRAAEARSLAGLYLAAAPNFRCDWNHGNAVHDANAVLGLLALQEGQRAAAVAHLLAAGQSRGSPQLDSFGPSLLLASRLAEAGEYDAMAAYVRAVRRFWEADDGSFLGLLGWRKTALMETWLAQLAARRVPDFGMNAMRMP